VRRSARRKAICCITPIAAASVWFPFVVRGKRAFIRSRVVITATWACCTGRPRRCSKLWPHGGILDKDVKVPDLLAQIAKDAVQQLSNLYSSGDTSYRSSSVRAYLDESPGQKNW
jgi:hypothetical protein